MAQPSALTPNLLAVLFPLQVLSTISLFGLIWFVQIVHYPLFARVGQDGFRRYASNHATRTTFVVAPLMLLELATAAAWLRPAWRPRFISGQEALWAFALLGVIWLSTALVQVPCTTASSVASRHFSPSAWWPQTGSVPWRGQSAPRSSLFGCIASSRSNFLRMEYST